MGQIIDKKIAYRRLELLVKRFKNDLTNGDISGSHEKTLSEYPATANGRKYSESQIRQGFILPMFRDILGWDIDNSINEVIPELYNHQGFADFVFVRNNQRKFVLETKKPSVNIDPNISSGRDGLRQVIGYARSLKDVNLAIVSNFELLVFSHSYIMPKTGEEIKNVLDWFHFSDFLSELKFETLWQFRFEACADKNFCSSLLKDVDAKIIKKHKTIDQNLLEDLKVVRVKLANSLSGKILDSEEADSLVHSIINRIIFIRSLEDRGVISSRLAELIGCENVWEKFKIHANKIFDKFPIELLNTKNDNFLDSKKLVIQDQAFSESLQMFYDRGSEFYHDCYDFKYIPSEILGYAYEHSIAFKLMIEKNYFKLKKKEFYKNGVHYTPTYITQNLSRKTILRSFIDKKSSSVKQLRCADIACGSGSFLTSIYDCLYSERIKEQVDSGMFELSNGISVLSLSERKEIIENCIFGIDIDSFAVEVAKLCLYLKFFENFPTEKKKLLVNEIPYLEQNVIFGDSLLDTSMKKKFSSKHFPIDSRHKKIFKLIKNKEIDVIVGNPPYIKIQDLKKIDSFPVELYTSIYGKTLGEGAIEFATAFVERAANILSKCGNAGFILPNKIFKNKQGNGLRGLLTETSTPNLREFVDFNSIQIFNASIYTCLLHLSNNKDNQEFKCSQIYQVDDVIYTLSEIEKFNIKYPSNDYEIGMLKVDTLTNNPWNLLVGIKRKLCDKLYKKFNEFKKIVPENKIFQGIPTGSDKIFLLKKISEKNKNIWRMTSESLSIIQHSTVKKENRKKKSVQPIVDIESKYLRPVFQGSTDLKHFSILDSDCYLLYPYADDGALLKNVDFFDSHAFKYLNTNQHRNGLKDARGKVLLQGLDERENRKYSGKYFYQYSRPQNLELWSKEKIMFPYLVEHFNAHLAYDNVFVNVSTGGYAVIAPDKEHLKYSLLAVLNSNVFNFLVKSSSGDFRGGWFECSSQYVASIPVPDINFSEEGISDLKLTIESLYEINAKLDDKNINVHDKLKKLTELNASLDWLNSFVSEKYELSEDEKSIIDFYANKESDLDHINDNSISEITKLVFDLERKLDEELVALSG